MTMNAGQTIGAGLILAAGSAAYVATRPEVEPIPGWEAGATTVAVVPAEWLLASFASERPSEGRDPQGRDLDWPPPPGELRVHPDAVPFEFNGERYWWMPLAEEEPGGVGRGGRGAAAGRGEGGRARSRSGNGGRIGGERGGRPES